MAQRKKSSTAGKKDKPSSRKTTGKTGNKASGNIKDPVNQFWSVILFAAGVLVFLLTVIEGNSGWKMIHNLFRGLFGLAVFLVPVIIIYTAVLIAMEKSQQTVTSRAAWGIGLTMLSSSVVQIMLAGSTDGSSFIEKCRYLYESGSRLEGGGLLSVFIAWPLMRFFGLVGAKIIVCILLFIFIMLLSNLTLFQFFGIFYKPFVKMHKSVQNLREESRMLREYEEMEYDEEQEAIQIANSSLPESNVVPDDEGFSLDIPIEKNEELDVPDFTAPELEKIDGFSIDVPIDKSNLGEGVTKPVNNASEASELNDLIVKAVEGKADAGVQETFAQKAMKAEELVPEKEIKAPISRKYVLPSVELLNRGAAKANDPAAASELQEKAAKLIETFSNFGIQVQIKGIQRGPRVTRYEIQPGKNVRVSKITGLSDDIALNLAAAGVRIEAPIPGKAAVGIEVPNTNQDVVSLREIIESREFREAKSKLSFAVGKDIAGNIITGDISKMPHMIIAGTTGSGKSVCTNSIIMSILFRANPDEVKLILIDPKMVEFTTYNGIPHLLIPVVTDPRQAAGALNWGVQEMLRRYKLFADNNVRDLGGYNELAAQKHLEKLPQIVIAIDEFSDLMMAASKEVEDSVCRLAQMARAAGMHLIIATQRPTTDVITGLIKANIPSRIALSVQSQVDSRTILDTQGAEKLLGYGDMLYYPNGMQKPLRVQGCFCSTKEVEGVVDFIKKESETEYNTDIIEAVEHSMPAEKNEKFSDSAESSGDGTGFYFIASEKA